MIEFDHVVKKFGKRKALDGVSLRLEKGCYGLLGPNGAGKTTLLRCMLGLYPVSGGAVRMGDGAAVGYLPQKFGVFRELSVRDALYYFACIKKIPKGERDPEISRALSQVNLEDRGRDRVSRLSGGMQRRVGIAQALLGDPDVLIFDEPTAGLDPEERARFKNLVRRAGAGRTVLISTHIVEDVESLCDRVIIMNQGQVLENVTTAEAADFAKCDDIPEPTLEQGYLARLNKAHGFSVEEG